MAEPDERLQTADPADPPDPIYRTPPGFPVGMDGHRNYLEHNQLRLNNYLNKDPDLASRVLSMASYTGLPYDVIEANIDEIEEEYRRDQNFDIDAWKKESPGFADYAMQNPYAFSVLKDDSEALGYWERNSRAIRLAHDSSWARVEANKIGIRRAHGDRREGDLDELAELEKWEQPHNFAADALWAKVLVWGAKQWGPMAYTIGNAWDETLIGLGTGAAAGAHVLGAGMVPGAGIGAVWGFRAGLYRHGYEMIGGESYRRYIAMGYSEENASMMARSVGAIGAAFEPFGISMLLKYIPGVGRITNTAMQSVAERLAMKTLRHQGMRAATGRIIARYGEVMGSEIIVEIAQDSAMTVGQNLLAQIEDKPDTVISLEQWGSQMAETAIETAKAMILYAGVGPGLSTFGEVKRVERAKRNVELFNNLRDAQGASKLAESAPEQFQAFAKKVAENGGLENVYIDADEFTTYFQEQGLNPDKIAEELGVNLEESKAQGTDVEIALDQYAANLAGTKHHDFLVPHLKARFDDLSQSEAATMEELRSDIERFYLNNEVPETHEPNQAIIDRLRNDLMAEGQYDFSASTKMATWMEYHYWIVQQDFPSIDIDEFFNRTYGGILRERTTVAEKIDVDTRVDPLLNLLRQEKGPRQREIYGESLVEFLTGKGGIQDQGGELGAMDLGLEFKKLVQATGLTLDAAAEVAHEAGYIVDYDTDLLLETLRRESEGIRTVGPGADPRAADISAELDELEEILARAEIDVQAMTNAEIRKALAGTKTHYQDVDIQTVGFLPDGVRPRQDFDELRVIVDYEVAGRPGEFVGTSQPANELFEDGKQRLFGMQELLECFNA